MSKLLNVHNYSYKMFRSALWPYGYLGNVVDSISTGWATGITEVHQATSGSTVIFCPTFGAS